MTFTRLPWNVIQQDSTCARIYLFSSISSSLELESSNNKNAVRIIRVTIDDRIVLAFNWPSCEGSPSAIRLWRIF